MINPKCRNPSRGPLEFPSLASGPFHAAWNLKASWLLEEALRAAGTASQFNNASLNGGDALRALEAALFMIDYDLPGYCAATASPAKPRPKPRPRVGAGARRGVTCYTLARKTLFTYDLSPDRLQIAGQAAYDTAVLQRVVDALWQSFGSTSFPLGNARDRVADGSAAAGFGTTFTAITGRSAQLASRLAAALVDIGILCLVDESPVLLTLVSLPATQTAVTLPSGLDVEASLARSSDDDIEE